jgi:hypothetical protein
MPKRRSRKKKAGIWGSILVLIGVVLVAYSQFAHVPLPGIPQLTGLPQLPGFGNTATPASQPPAGGPGARQTPQEETFQGCPPEGDGGDSQLNLLKNRIDEGNYQPLTVDAMLGWTWPPAIERRDMDTWSAEARAEVNQRNGLPVAMQGYWLEVKSQGAESTNCHATEADFVDYHLWLASAPDKARAEAVVVEVTPRLRAKHSQWGLSHLRDLVNAATPVRISGWVMLDPEHPDQVGKTRGTIWEIHPVMKIEYQQNGQWVELP